MATMNKIINTDLNVNIAEAINRQGGGFTATLGSRSLRFTGKDNTVIELIVENSELTIQYNNSEVSPGVERKIFATVAVEGVIDDETLHYETNTRAVAKYMYGSSVLNITLFANHGEFKPETTYVDRKEIVESYNADTSRYVPYLHNTDKQLEVILDVMAKVDLNFQIMRRVYLNEFNIGELNTPETLANAITDTLSYFGTVKRSQKYRDLAALNLITDCFNQPE